MLFSQAVRICDWRFTIDDWRVLQSSIANRQS